MGTITQLCREANMAQFRSAVCALLQMDYISIDDHMLLRNGLAGTGQDD